MTIEEINHIKKSWKLFRNIDPAVVGDTFYSKLFAAHPSLRRMFPKNMDPQYHKLINMLNTIVSRLDHLDQLTDDIAAMARRHVEYGVKPLHYRLVGEALLWTLSHGLGNDWTPATSNAWTKCYHLLSETMISSAYPATAKK